MQSTTNTLVVAHQSLNRALLAEFAGIPRRAAMTMKHSADYVLRLDCNGSMMQTKVVGELGWSAASA